MIEYFDRHGAPMTQGAWAAKFESADYKRVARSVVSGIEISTVWLGLNHRFGDGPPLIFETMVFGIDGDDDPQWRYSTEADALRGHKKVVAAVSDNADLNSIDVP